MVCRLGVNDFNLAGDEALGNLLRKGKTEHAFLVTQDELAIPVIKFLDKNGVKVPQELAVASLDNIRFAETALVPLTTVGFDLRYIHTMPLISCWRSSMGRETGKRMKT